MSPLAFYALGVTACYLVACVVAIRAGRRSTRLQATLDATSGDYRLVCDELKHAIEQLCDERRMVKTLNIERTALLGNIDRLTGRLAEALKLVGKRTEERDGAAAVSVAWAGRHGAMRAARDMAVVSRCHWEKQAREAWARLYAIDSASAHKLPPFGATARPAAAVQFANLFRAPEAIHAR